MDVIVIGKRSFAFSEPPEVLYCGQSRDEALAAVNKDAGAHPLIYYVDPQPFQRIPYYPPDHGKKKAKASAQVVTEAPAQVVTEDSATPPAEQTPAAPAPKKKSK